MSLIFMSREDTPAVVWIVDEKPPAPMSVTGMAFHELAPSVRQLTEAVTAEASSAALKVNGMVCPGTNRWGSDMLVIRGGLASVEGNRDGKGLVRSCEQSRRIKNPREPDRSVVSM